MRPGSFRLSENFSAAGRPFFPHTTACVGGVQQCRPDLSAFSGAKSAQLIEFCVAYVKVKLPEKRPLTPQPALIKERSSGGRTRHSAAANSKKVRSSITPAIPRRIPEVT